MNFLHLLLFSCIPSCEYIACPVSTCRATKRKRKPRYTVDSGATIHCINDPSLFTSCYTPDHPIVISTANGSRITATLVGNVDVQMEDAQGRMRTITLYNCVYSPHFHSNLISVRRLWKDSRIKTRFGETNFFHDTQLHFRCRFTHDREYVVQSVHHLHNTPSIDAHTLHSRFGHVGARRLRKLLYTRKRLA